ncbi:hypothetical protein CYMTET_15325 [Cymbomonas tetramitiformis]|uniref:EF-hand domain-containing protein n=1 Tax=Cymbomonas tetramitiformis TaxID=36881 RepID=A0AAE0L9F3_9CHLO|nr:hypothetical protein CYMTET_15325 [Cymbomonas tetramitiformis]
MSPLATVAEARESGNFDGWEEAQEEVQLREELLAHVAEAGSSSTHPGAGILPNDEYYEDILWEGEEDPFDERLMVSAEQIRDADHEVQGITGQGPTPASSRATTPADDTLPPRPETAGASTQSSRRRSPDRPAPAFPKRPSSSTAGSRKVSSARTEKSRPASARTAYQRPVREKSPAPRSSEAPAQRAQSARTPSKRPTSAAVTGQRRPMSGLPAGAQRASSDTIPPPDSSETLRKRLLLVSTLTATNSTFSISTNLVPSTPQPMAEVVTSNCTEEILARLKKGYNQLVQATAAKQSRAEDLEEELRMTKTQMEDPENARVLELRAKIASVLEQQDISAVQSKTWEHMLKRSKEEMMFDQAEVAMMRDELHEAERSKTHMRNQAAESRRLHELAGEELLVQQKTMEDLQIHWAGQLEQLRDMASDETLVLDDFEAWQEKLKAIRHGVHGVEVDRWKHAVNKQERRSQDTYRRSLTVRQSAMRLQDAYKMLCQVTGVSDGVEALVNYFESRSAESQELLAKRRSTEAEVAAQVKLCEAAKSELDEYKVGLAPSKVEEPPNEMLADLSDTQAAQASCNDASNEAPAGEPGDVTPRSAVKRSLAAAKAHRHQPRHPKVWDRPKSSQKMRAPLSTRSQDKPQAKAVRKHLNEINSTLAARIQTQMGRNNVRVRSTEDEMALITRDADILDFIKTYRQSLRDVIASEMGENLPDANLHDLSGVCAAFGFQVSAAELHRALIELDKDRDGELDIFEVLCSSDEDEEHDDSGENTQRTSNAVVTRIDVKSREQRIAPRTNTVLAQKSFGPGPSGKSGSPTRSPTKKSAAGDGSQTARLAERSTMHESASRMRENLDKTAGGHSGNRSPSRPMENATARGSKRSALPVRSPRRPASSGRRRRPASAMAKRSTSPTLGIELEPSLHIVC